MYCFSVICTFVSKGPLDDTTSLLWAPGLSLKLQITHLHFCIPNHWQTDQVLLFFYVSSGHATPIKKNLLHIQPSLIKSPSYQRWITPLNVKYFPLTKLPLSFRRLGIQCTTHTDHFYGHFYDVFFVGFDSCVTMICHYMENISSFVFHWQKKHKGLEWHKVG